MSLTSEDLAAIGGIIEQKLAIFLSRLPTVDGAPGPGLGALFGGPTGGAGVPEVVTPYAPPFVCEFIYGVLRRTGPNQYGDTKPFDFPTRKTADSVAARYGGEVVEADAGDGYVEARDLATPVTKWGIRFTRGETAVVMQAGLMAWAILKATSQGALNAADNANRSEIADAFAGI